MSHNKMYRYIEGYENALSLSCDVMDEVEELTHDLRYGESCLDVINRIESIEKMLSKVKKYVENGNGKPIAD